jgi:hypothetical protein
VQHSGDLAADDLLLLAWMVWSLVHGIAKLAISGNLPQRPLHHRISAHASRAIFTGMKAGPSGCLER